MQGYDNYRFKKDDILRLYLLGKNEGQISGLTGVPKIRIRRELAKAIEKDPALLKRHLAACYRKQRRMLRYPTAMIVIDPRELAKAVKEY